jgi:hypothetical protein
LRPASVVAAAALNDLAELPALTHLIILSRARGGGAAGGARFLFCQFAGGVEAIALSIEVDRPLPS